MTVVYWDSFWLGMICGLPAGFVVASIGIALGYKNAVRRTPK